ncbi:hypothetical protein BY458DRAFT_558118 [Sporodiniella umbellata]|nr:hypothetical protein BY458DRAFT_558118 [Sporodiniella umbellata]
MAGKGVVRSIKNIAKGFSDVQIKVREATSNDPWGPSGTMMNEISQLTFNESDFIEIMDMIDKRLNDKGKNWRHVFKALLLLDYCLHVGSENVVLYAKENIYVVKTLKEFQHVDETGKDVGANVRQKAKDITNLLMDDNRLREERQQRQGMRDRMANIGDYLNETVRQINGNENRYDDEAELKRALAESKRLAEAERQGEDDLQKAIQLSQQEAIEKEQKDKEKQQNLFGIFQQPSSQQSMAFHNPYQQQQQQQQQPLQLEWSQPNNGFQNNPYQQQQTQNPYQSAFSPSTLQAQMTGFVQPGTDFYSQSTGFSSMNPPQQQSFQASNDFMSSPKPQTSMVTGTNPFSQMNSTPQLQPQQPLQQGYDYSSLAFGNPQQQQQPFAPSPKLHNNSNSPFNVANKQQQQQQQPFAASPKLHNNSNSPFNRAAGSPSMNAFSSLTASHSNPSPSNAFSSPQMSSAKPPSEADSKYAKLNALLSNKDDGLDTFGNQGNLRIPYGSGYANSLPTQSRPTGSMSPSSAFGTTSKNPFGQAIENKQPTNQKSLLDLMQEQKQPTHQTMFTNAPPLQQNQTSFF